MGERIMVSKYGLPSMHTKFAPHGHGYIPGEAVQAMGLLGTAPKNSLLAAYLHSADAKRGASSRPDIDHYIQMLMDGLLEEWRPLHPHTDAEALQMVRNFLASRNVNLDFAHLRPEHANHDQWRERLKHLLIHYLKQAYVKQHPGLQRAMKWYLNRLKHTIWVRRRLLNKRISIARMNFLFSYLQALDHAIDQREYRFDIYKEIDRTAALKKRLEELITLQEVKMNPELNSAFKFYISKLTEALEETKKHQPVVVSNVSLVTPNPALFPEKVITYVDIVQEFIEKKKTLENPEEILDGQSLDTVGGIRTFLEHYLTTTEVQNNATLADAINTFLGNLKKLPSHHLLDRHLKRETIQKIATKYEMVYEYLSKLEWKRSSTPNEILQRALETPEVQSNASLVDAIKYYLEHSPKDQEEEQQKEEKVYQPIVEEPEQNEKEVNLKIAEEEEEKQQQKNEESEKQQEVVEERQLKEKEQQQKEEEVNELKREEEQQQTKNEQKTKQREDEEENQEKVVEQKQQKEEEVDPHKVKEQQHSENEEEKEQKVEEETQKIEKEEPHEDEVQQNEEEQIQLRVQPEKEEGKVRERRDIAKDEDNTVMAHPVKSIDKKT